MIARARELASAMQLHSVMQLLTGRASLARRAHRIRITRASEEFPNGKS
jgi:hypothetical protein